MNRPLRLTIESSNRCAGFFRAMKARLDLSLAECARSMGMDPTRDHAVLSRMENAVGTWDYNRFDAFTDFAADRLRVELGHLRAALLGDGTLDAIQRILAWNYVRLGSDSSSKLLCRLECRWKPASRWTIYFHHLPPFLLPDIAHEQFDWQLESTDAKGEISQVFESMLNRFLLWDAAARPQLVLVPTPGAMAHLIRRQGAYGNWDEASLADTIEFLHFDGIQASGTRFARNVHQARHQIFGELDWLLVSDDLVVRRRMGARVLDYVNVSTTRMAPVSATVGELQHFLDPAHLCDVTTQTKLLFDRVLKDLK